MAVVSGSPRERSGRHPHPGDLALVVEVADSSLDTDRTTKARLYARAGIAAYWIVNLVDRCLEVLEDPTGPDVAPRYRQTNTYRPGADDAVELAVDGHRSTIPVTSLIP